MKIINDRNELIVDLFHGTSSIFVDSILKNGLGAVDPLSEWNLFEFGEEVYDLSVKYLKETELFNKTTTFKNIIEQTNDGKMNYQHGNTYLSTLEPTAVNYALSNPYGSEFLSCIMDFLKELINLKEENVVEELKVKYPMAFEFAKLNPKPILIKVKNVNIDSLLNELGDSPEANLVKINDCHGDEMKYRVRLDQCNFRLVSPVTLDNIEIWNITDGVQYPFNPQYKLVEFSSNNTP